MTAQSLIFRPLPDGSFQVEMPIVRKAEPAALVISQYLAEKGMPVDMIRRTVAPFGKVLRTEFLMARGQEPPKVERWIGGKMRQVAYYTTADRDLFDRTYKLVH